MSSCDGDEIVSLSDGDEIVSLRDGYEIVSLCDGDEIVSLLDGNETAFAFSSPSHGICRSDTNGTKRGVECRLLLTIRTVLVGETRLVACCGTSGGHEYNTRPCIVVWISGQAGGISAG